MVYAKGEAPAPKPGCAPGGPGSGPRSIKAAGLGTWGVEIALDPVPRESREGPTLPETR